MTEYRIRYNARTNHIEGIAERTRGTGNDTGTGAVPYYASTACAALTRAAHRMGITGETHTDLAATLAAARLSAAATGRKLCTTCEKKALAAIRDAYTIARNHARHAADLLDIATTVGDEAAIAAAEDRAERAGEVYDAAAAAAGRCRILSCEAEALEDRPHCTEHDDDPADEDPAPATWCGARTTHDAITYGCIVTGEHEVHEARTGLRWYDGKRPFNCDKAHCADCEANAARLAEAAKRAAEATAPAAGQLYRITNPLTGAVEFHAKTLPGAAGWAGYFRTVFGRVEFLGWSNAATEADALADITAGNPTGDDYAVAAAHPVTAGERDTYLDRRAQLAPTDGERAKWADVLIGAALDYARIPADDPESAIAKAHLEGLCERVVERTAERHRPRGWYVQHVRRIATKADVAARCSKIATEAMNQRHRVEAVEYRVVQYLERRDALIAALEAVVPWG